MTVNDYIRENWKNSIRAGENKGLPYPFNSPSCEQTSDVGFENFFYWDTYFINLGLLCDGMRDQALNNIKNIHIHDNKDHEDIAIFTIYGNYIFIFVFRLII